MYLFAQTLRLRNTGRLSRISSLMILDGTNRTVKNRAYMKRGDRVMIMEGPLKGLVGFYISHKDRTDRVVVVSIELLHRSLDVEIEDWALEKIEW
jgi:transcription antitermination factor NusG